MQEPLLMSLREGSNALGAGRVTTGTTGLLSPNRMDLMGCRWARH